MPIINLDLRYLINRNIKGNSPTLHSKKLKLLFWVSY